MKVIFQILSLCFLGLLPQKGYSQKNWKLVENKNGIMIFTRLAFSSKFKEVKVVTDLPGTTKQLINTILDVENHRTWVYGVKQAYPIEKQNNSPFIYYCEYSLPLVTDRDMVLEIKYSEGSKNQQAVMEINSIPEKLPEKKNLIRISKLFASWEIFPMSDKKMKVTYILRVDPAGEIPAFIYNPIVTRGPYKSFMKLKTMLQ
ncbi:hypothetical protein AHMF7605_03365 [Adhaeribacter arboris]|uniref:START domain-containing protein n=1 Tax=Adhaeribacter arboris TaxID=2072846 RepID=A0A2T2YAT0_9BACT|nr:START domain-containing protein [Adhaeribacter arboris]PSR52630.1 hypothetical protein AHMF7605_03365 [Adhaeribacter arboris]